MGTKIQDYDLEPALRALTADLRDTRTHFNKNIKDLLTAMSTTQQGNVTDISDLKTATGDMDTALKELEGKMITLQGLVGYSSVGEEDDEVFTYDPVTEDIVKHEVMNAGNLKFKVEYYYTNGNISSAVKTYEDSGNIVEVTTTFTYSQSGNVSAMSHRRTVTPIV
ncbi:hypothetical protein C0431_12245 [bacterium]|nr:hypothetical protein [bacterium]